MRIFYEVLPNTLGRVMYRIRREIRENAPSWVEFVDNTKEADLQILDSIGTGSMEYLKCDKYVLLQHCYLTAITPSYDYWYSYWNKAKMVASFLDLPGQSKFNDFNFYSTPWGVNPDIFYRENEEVRPYKALTTGYIADTECIGEVFEAVKFTKSKMVHLGGALFSDPNICSNYENITDKKLRQLYNSCEYVAGMRRIEGLELPLLEGLLCGARGITLDIPAYRYWYEDYVEYVEDGSFEHVRNQLISIFSKPVRTVTNTELIKLIDKFSWKNVANNFWNKLGESI